MIKRITFLLALINIIYSRLPAFGQTIPGFEEVIYKMVDSVELKLFIRYPENQTENQEYPALIFFFGGGWNSGRITQFKPHAEYFASRGMITILADYRVKTRHNTTPFEAVSDAKSAIRYLRRNSEKLQIDSSKIAASGGSAGGHLAAATATLTGLDEPSESQKVSSKPNALILFNPVFDNGPEGYGYERTGSRYAEISPLHNIRAGTPPTIVFLGTNDTLIPVKTAILYKQKMEECGCRCDLFLYEGQMHGFFNFREDITNDNKYYWETITETDKFLVSLGYLSDETPPKK